MTMAGGQNGDSIGAHGNGIYSGSCKRGNENSSVVESVKMV